MTEEHNMSDTDALQMAVSQITNNQDEQEQLIEEPEAKRRKLTPDETMSDASCIKQILFNVNKAICLRLDGIESKLETINLRCKYLEEKLDNMSDSYPKVPDQGGGGEPNTPQQSRSSRSGNSNQNYTPRRQSTIIIGLPQNQHGQDAQTESQVDESAGSQISNASNESSPAPNLGSNVTLITLNSEEDYPQGTWLGDENNIEMRVRTHVTPSDMLHIHSTCRTAEKMALTLLDYLFDRETQACSNISGMGKHGKKQLDPLMIYGIRCHLIHKFGISETDWHRIKQNVDSKCRTAFRRKQKGQSLSVKAFSRKSPTATTIYAHQIHSEEGEEMQAVTQAAVEQMQQMHQQIHIQHVQGDESVVQQTIPEQVTVQVTQSGDAIHIQQGDTIQIQQGEAVAIPQGEIQIAVNPDVQVHEVQQIQGGEIHIQHPAVQLQESQ
ncbi:protein BANP-like isoform X2 [Ptychodera flava]|uniref:protein BANP-like isoform X2 n=1 Tax=Ptychodera flava TaxID=63121 RepID=UPI00396AAFF7